MYIVINKTYKQHIVIILLDHKNNQRISYQTYIPGNINVIQNSIYP